MQGDCFRWARISGILLCGLVACTKSEPVDSPVVPSPSVTAAVAAADGSTGAIEVTVAFDGDAPDPKPLDLRTDVYCRKLKVTDPSVTVNDDDTLRNVVVRLEGVDGQYEPDPERRVTIGQKKCLFVPRVQVAMRGEKMAVTNDDPTLHNVHAYKGPNDENWFNLAQPKSAPAIVKNLNIEDRTRVRCDIHPWMDAWVFVADHPFQGVTGGAGPVALTNVPARGKPYRLVTWHERYGTKEAMVRVEGGKVAKVTVRYSPDDEGS